MKLKRIWFVVLLLLTLLLVMSACDNTDDDDEDMADDDISDDDTIDDDTVDDDTTDDDTADDDTADDDTIDDDTADDDTVDPTSWVWSLYEGEGPSKRVMGRMVYDTADETVIYFGGGSGFPNNETWLWNGAQWTQAQPVNSPSGRMGSAMAYDHSRDRTVLFGGASLIPYGHQDDTWEYDGATWTKINTPTTPPERSEAGMAYDPDREVIVMFGGCNGDACAYDLGDTWEYDGTDWTPVVTVDAPFARNGATMFFDSVRRTVVLFAGAGYGKWPNDMWEYDGENWASFAPDPVPPGRCVAAADCDDTHGFCLLFGGYSGMDYLGDTWLWDGAAWTELGPFAGTISDRSQSVMAFHEQAGHFVLHGGFWDSGFFPLFYDETWIFGVPK